MSSASSGRYQSKLFNFVHQRSRQLSEECVRAFRRLQVATTWSVQALLYPVYLLLSNEQAAKQIHSPTPYWTQLQPSADPGLQPPPTTDTPIQRVLLAVNTLSSEELATTASKDKKETPLLALLTSWRSKFLKTKHKSNSSLTHSSPPPCVSPSFSHPLTSSPISERPTIQGIATQLATRSLVLVTDRNEVLDILTPQQQQKLQQRIIGEVAEYWRYWRLHLILPVQDAETESQQTELILPSQQAIAFLDRTLAKLESSGLAPVSVSVNALSQRSQEIVRAVQAQFNMSWFGKGQVIDAPSGFTPETDTHTLRIQALIWAAVNYFFGGRREKQIGRGGEGELGVPSGDKGARGRGGERLVSSKPQRQGLHRHSQLPPTKQRLQLDGVEEEPWLTMSDLFGSPPEGDPNPHSQEDVSQIPGRQNRVLPSNDLLGSIGDAMQRLSDRFHRSSPPHPLAPLSPQGTPSSPSPPHPLKSTQSVSAGVTTQSCSQTTQVEHTPDWIETPAAAMGYVKHPLEQLLEWLDLALLWLEKGLVKVWQWVRARVKGKG